MIQTILMSQFPLPYAHIGSWTTLYRNYLESGQSLIDIIICEKPPRFFDGVQYVIVTDNKAKRLSRKLSKNPHGHFIAALAKAIRPGHRYILQVVDNQGLARSVQRFVARNNLASRVYLQFFYHGFSPFGNASFFEKTNEIVFLTHGSYKAFQSRINALPVLCSVLHNGVDTRKFYKLALPESNRLRSKLGFAKERIFVWCSQDRPKKGLDFLLQVWKRIAPNYPDALLLVIGCEPRTPQQGVRFIGRVPNDELPQYFQIANVYLFPTLWQEGFGMSLIEALHCGCHGIASALGGVPEVLKDGKLGRLVNNPHFIAEWVAAIEEYLCGQHVHAEMPPDLYTTQNWNNDMTRLITEAKVNLGPV